MSRDRGTSLDSRTLGEVLGVVRALANEARSGGYLFRGEPKCYPLVSSSLYRQFPDIQEQHFHVEQVQKEMLEAATEFVGQCDKDDLVAQLQHYGHPTNLIDFSTDYHVALFFACDGQTKEDGRVVLLKESDYPTMKPRSPISRVLAQKSIFVRPPAGVVEPRARVVIPGRLKEPILDYLGICHGIERATIYNDIHGFMRHHNVHKSAYVEFYAGITHYLKGEHEKGICRYARAIELNPRFGMAYNNRGAAYLAMQNHLAAVGDFDRVIDLEPDNAGAFSNRGLAHWHLGDPDSAFRDLDHAIQLDPTQAEAYVNRGNVYNARGDDDRAIADYDKGLQIEPDSPDILSNRGGTYSRKGEHARGIQDHDRAVALAPEAAKIRGRRGEAYWRKGDYDSAVRDYTRAIELDSKSEYFNGRGSAYWHKGDHGRAIRDFDKAIELNPRLAIAYHNRGVAGCALGSWASAAEDLSTAQELGFDTVREFRDEFGSVSSFEKKYGVRLDPMLAALLAPD